MHGDVASLSYLHFAHDYTADGVALRRSGPGARSPSHEGDVVVVDGESRAMLLKVAIHRCSCALCTVNRARTTTATNEGRFVLRGAAPQLYPLRAA
jgi:hypothetical protein